MAKYTTVRHIRKLEDRELVTMGRSLIAGCISRETWCAHESSRIILLNERALVLRFIQGTFDRKTPQ